MYPEQAGAGGNWPVIDEILDPSVIEQQGDLSCGIACGAMLLKDRKINSSQSAIETITGIPVSCQVLAIALNTLDPDPSRQWEGGSLELPGATHSQLFEILNTTGSWAAVLWEMGAGIGHLVVVDGIDAAGYALIRDPWQGSRYRMTIDNFLKYWTTEAVFSRSQQ
ncbi:MULTISPECIES: papain-like cysteine protease family protein [unclassified Coleofasciculus]|jgi:filamentous hemagglutinin|uniref:papain-like cysteine protease family protein n=1 Tax=Coleofasciculus TaxID=669368 RepID=UPI00187EE522|nr:MULTISPECIES: papain-like cysteine protease family protein [unclassified Coleofasciculus]MBE9126929.1 hypothetical protein [Coleofasciculus sp. LEGE 07081]MBE9148660.1 hypothetical protein [Coleofasciculus sp. LEGE 07092]